MTYIRIGEGITTIGDYAFANCTNVDTIYCMSMFSPQLYANTFSGISRDICVCIPCERLTYYVAISYWFEFTHIEEVCIYEDDETNPPDAGIITIAATDDDIEKENTLILYPNPAKESITLTAVDDIFIYNSLGQIVRQMKNPKGETTINISDLPQGTYYIKSDNKQQKLIKE